MMKIGLTGGIASGKSTVSKWLIDHGYPVIDADEISRQVVEPGEPALEQIAAQFGNQMIRPTGELDRRKLGTLVFQNSEKRALLDSLLHPLIRRQMLETLDHLERGGARVVFLDIPLLFENGLDTWADKTIVVSVTEDNQLKRLMARNSLTADQARARIASQMPLSEKVNRADAVIDNNGSIEDTEAQLNALLQQWALDLT
ncbi:dephospho-CoA kinase [Sporolactobacillus laevolacticus]|uniref:Dephospho-CoA kinase n=1 Tax=Sporolactobacillus laevolacticus DSM 442 TaxID=1395513 RepID=V6J9S7_9BACL|nr:dephospho-CoA kinase [Sporolactobacillus laevolacticus]EST13539.1 dephospho-CoA kinase [Sporolactobacillus laevolacticus DSM 442]